MSKRKAALVPELSKLTNEEARSLLDALSDDPSNDEENDLLQQHNPLLAKAILKLRDIAGHP